MTHEEQLDLILKKKSSPRVRRSELLSLIADVKRDMLYRAENLDKQKGPKWIEKSP